MIEQLLENWLTKATEKSFQIPFCFMLANNGYTVVHLTRHCGMEHGKDVLAIDKDGFPCAFQLKGTKGGKIKLSSWRSELMTQTDQLVRVKLMHPSIPTKGPHHKSYLVTNGELDEEVASAIANNNNSHDINGQPEYKLGVIVKGNLIDWAKKLGMNFIPPDFNDFRLLLEFYLENGNGTLDKEKFAYVLERIFDRDAKETERGQVIRGSALITSLATTSYSNAENHIAVVEAWTIYISYLFRFVEQHKVAKKIWENEFNIAEKIVVTSLENLWKEVEPVEHFLMNNALEDGFVHNARATWIIGFLSSLGIYFELKGGHKPKSTALYALSKKHQKYLEIYGESAVPNFLAFYWFSQFHDKTQSPDELLGTLLKSILTRIRRTDALYAEPYYLIDESLSMRFEEDEKLIDEMNQKGTSYYLEGLIHLYVRENYKQQMIVLWPEISLCFFKSFKFNAKLDFYRWHNSKGKEVLTTPVPTKVWNDLRAEAEEAEGSEIPDLLKSHPHLYSLFLNVFPFRGTSSGMRWFDQYLRSLGR